MSAFKGSIHGNSVPLLTPPPPPRDEGGSPVALDGLHSWPSCLHLGGELQLQVCAAFPGLCNAGNRTQVLMQVRKALYLQSYSPAYPIHSSLYRHVPR